MPYSKVDRHWWGNTHREKSVLTFCNSKLDTISPNTKAVPPNTNAVATAKAFPTIKEQKLPGISKLSAESQPEAKTCKPTISHSLW